MGIGLTYKDTIELVETVVDKYGTERQSAIHTIPALFIQNTDWDHSNNQNVIMSNGEIYIDPKDSFVSTNVFRLEEMLVIANPFGGDENRAWYRIVDVMVGQDKLLGNTIDNIKLELKKTTKIPEYVS